MATTYNGSASGIAAHEAPAITIAQSTDLLSEEGFNVALRKLADYVAYLNSKGALLDAVNAFAATQQISAGDLELTNAAAQAILKATGGKLQVGTKVGNASDLELVIGGVVRALLRASDGRLGNLLDPVNAQDAATKAYADAREVAAKAYTDAAPANAWGSVVLAANWAEAVGGRSSLYKDHQGFVDLHVELSASAGAGVAMMNANGLPAGYRPAADLIFAGVNASYSPFRMNVKADGSVNALIGSLANTVYYGHARYRAA